jgi:hypothetical protein
VGLEGTENGVDGGHDSATHTEASAWVSLRKADEVVHKDVDAANWLL